MRIRIGTEFPREAERYGLRFLCPECLNFLPETRRCGNEWPNEDHLAPPALPAGEGDVLFCKEFELA